MKLKNQQFKNIHNIIFDLGNVLLDIDISKSIAAFRNLGLTGLKPEEIHPLNTGIFLDLELGKITQEQFVETLQNLAPPEHQPSFVDIIDAWNALLLDVDFKRFELIDELSKKYNIFLLSNTNKPHRECFIQQFNSTNPQNRTFESYFKRCFYSDVMQIRKPGKEIYLSVLTTAGIDPEETLFIDDNAQNLIAPNELGMNTYHILKPETILDLFEK